MTFDKLKLNLYHFYKASWMVKIAALYPVRVFSANFRVYSKKDTIQKPSSNSNDNFVKKILLFIKFLKIK